MYDLVVHFGAPKAGSSAIQYFLLQNRSVLEQTGYYYPLHGHDRNAVSGGHSRLGVAIREEARLSEAKQILSEYIHDAKKRHKTLLISAESLYAHMVAFKEITNGLKVKVIGFYRDPLESILSSYNQLVKRSFMTGTLTSYCQSLLAKPSVSMAGGAHEKWADLFGDEHVSILPYDQSLFMTESIERRFLSAVGVAKCDYSKFQFLDKPVNGSYSRSALALKRLLNLVLDQKRSRLNYEIDRCLQSYSDRHSERKGGLAELIPREVYEGLVNKFRKSNDSIRARFFPDTDVQFLTDQNQIVHAVTPFNASGDYSAAYVANIAFAEHDELIEYIKNCILDYCASTRERGFEQYALADLVGLTLGAPGGRAGARFLNAKQIERITGDKIGVPQMLRELAVAHETIGDIDAARKLIERACALRPDSVLMQTVRDRILKTERSRPPQEREQGDAT